MFPNICHYWVPLSCGAMRHIESQGWKSQAQPGALCCFSPHPLSGRFSVLCSTSLLSSLWAPRLTLYAKLFAFPNASSTSQPGHYPSISRMNLLSLPYLASLPGNNNISILSVPHGWRPLCHSFPVVLGDSSQVLSVVSCCPSPQSPPFLPPGAGACTILPGLLRFPPTCPPCCQSFSPSGSAYTPLPDL